MTAEDVCNLVRSILLALVDNEQAVRVHPVEGRESLIVEVEVDEKDIGKVVGKSGRHLQAIRMLVHAASRKLGKRITVQPLGTFDQDAAGSYDDAWKEKPKKQAG